MLNDDYDLLELKEIAEETGVSIKEVEKAWRQAKRDAKIKAMKKKRKFFKERR